MKMGKNALFFALFLLTLSLLSPISSGKSTGNKKGRVLKMSTSTIPPTEFVTMDNFDESDEGPTPNFKKEYLRSAVGDAEKSADVSPSSSPSASASDNNNNNDDELNFENVLNSLPDICTSTPFDTSNLKFSSVGLSVEEGLKKVGSACCNSAQLPTCKTVGEIKAIWAPMNLEVVPASLVEERAKSSSKIAILAKILIFFTPLIILTV